MPDADDYAQLRHGHLEMARRALRRHRGDVVLSHETAAVALGLPTYRVPPKVSLTRRDGSRRTAGRTHVYVAPFEAREVVMRDGLPVTTVPRTVVDVARTRPFMEALVTADAALRRRYSRDALGLVVAGMQRWPGISAAADVVRWADGRAESACESVVRARCILLGLPMPALQVWVPTAGGDRRVDFLWEEVGLVGEADGRVKYKGERDLWDEKQRRDDLEEDRWVLRWTWRQAHAPDDEFCARFWRLWGRAVLLKEARAGMRPQPTPRANPATEPDIPGAFAREVTWR